MSHILRPRLFLAAALILAAAAVEAQPTITGVSDTELARSRRVAITGLGFGASGGVFVAGLPAWTTTWTETRIVAYVPEAAALGSATLYAVAEGEPSNEIPLTVTARQGLGQVRWTFEADSANLWWRPALGPDGTLYLHATNLTDGIVYALSPTGALLWVQHVDWSPYVPPTSGPDGAVYVGSIDRIYRLSPQGQIDWEFQDPGAQGIHVSPTIGPDGRLYAAFDHGLGAVALDPATGSLEWSNSGDPLINDYGTLGTEMRFGPSQPGGPVDQLYFHMDGVGNASFYAFSLDGDQRFTAGLAAVVSHEPAIGSDATIYVPRFIGLSIAALDPGSGDMLWDYQGGWATGVANVEISPRPDDTLYFVGGSGHLEAYGPHGRSRLWRNSTGQVLGRPTVSPDGSLLVLNGVPNHGQPGFVRAYDAATGEEVWNVDLPGDPFPGLRVLGIHRPRFTASGSTVFVSTYTTADGSPPADPVSYLYAIDTGLGEMFTSGFECGDTTEWSTTVP